jgi:hypothetical protein
VSSPLSYLNSVRKHWGTLVTSGAGIGVLGIWQSTGHFVPHWVYWSVGCIGLVVAFYKTWPDEHKIVQTLTTQLGQSALGRQQESERRLRELIGVIALLRETEGNAVFWRDIAKDKWGRAPASAKSLRSHPSRELPQKSAK